MRFPKILATATILAAFLLGPAPGTLAAATDPPRADPVVEPSDPRGRIESRREARAPEIARLRALGVVGENRDARLEIVGRDRMAEPGRLAEIQRLVRSENGDREAWIEVTCRVEGRTESEVRREMAALAREAVRPGEWIQDPEGRWRRK
jgi:hypothetical protein